MQNKSLSEYYKSKNEIFQEFSRLSKKIKPEVILAYLLLLENKLDEDNIQEGLESDNPVTFFGSKFLYQAIQNLKGDFLQLSENDLDELFTFDSNFICNTESGDVTGIINSLIFYTVEQRSHGHAYSLPSELGEFLVQLVELNSEAKVYNPFAGTGSFSHYLQNQQFLGQEKDFVIWILGLLKFANNHEPDFFELKLEDSIKAWRNIEGLDDVVICSPPFNVQLERSLGLTNEFGRINKTEEFVLFEGTKKLTGRQKAIFLLPSSVLSSNSKFLKNYRKNLVDNGMISTIVQFPAGILEHSGIKVSAVLVQSPREHSSPIRMIDLTKEGNQSSRKSNLNQLSDFGRKLKEEKELITVRYITQTKVKDNDYDLNVLRYWLPTYPGLKLSGLLKRIKVEYNSDVLAFYPEVRLKNLLNDPIEYVLRADQSSKGLSDKPIGGFVSESCLLISMHMGNLKPTWLEVNNESVCIAPNIVAFHVDTEKVHLPYLIQTLHSKEVNEQVMAYGGASILQTLTFRDFMSIKMELPALSDQKDLVSSFRRRIIKEEEKRLSVLRDKMGVDIADDISFLKHSLAGNLQKSRDAAEDLTKIINEIDQSVCPGIKESKAENDSTLPLHKYLTILNRELESARQTLSRASLNIDILDKQIEEVSLFNFIQSYTEEVKILRRNIFKIYFKYDDIFSEDVLKENLIVKADRKLLKKVLDNIIDNANKHAFNDIPEEDKELQVKVSYKEGGKNIRILISNTGNSLPENYDTAQFIRKGNRTGSRAGNGYGGFLIHTILQVHGGKIKLVDNTGPDGGDNKYVTTCAITLPVNLNL